MNGPSAGASERRTFTLRKQDLIEVHRRNFWSNLRTGRFIVTFVVVMGLLLAGSFLTKGASDVIGWAIWAIGFSVLFPLAMTRFVIPRQTRAAMRREPRFAEPWHVDFDPVVLTISNALGVSQYFWTGFTSRRVGRTMLVLTTTGQGFVPIPLRALQDGDLETIDARLRQAGVELD